MKQRAGNSLKENEKCTINKMAWKTRPPLQ